MARSWLITGKGIAKKIRNAGHLSNYQISELAAEACRECPNCNHLIDNNDVSLQWPGLPAGVKFDPSDLELLDHLEGKVGLGNLKPHILLDEFIPTLNEEEGICYTHPANLPGIKKDGSSTHFFHRTSNAYGCGQRKRRKISNNDHAACDEHVRWHKTGKSKAVIDNGVTKGWKKIMVLYKGPRRGARADKTNWVMHQYHLGVDEDEKDGELVVSKVFYQSQPKQLVKSEMDAVDEESDAFAARIDPRTPKTNTPQPRRPNNSPCETEQNAPILEDQEEEEVEVPIVRPKDEAESPTEWPVEPQAVKEGTQPNLDESLRCHEVLDSISLETSLPFEYPSPYDLDAFPDLDNVDLGTLPDLTLADLQFGSQDSISSWLDRT